VQAPLAETGHGREHKGHEEHEAHKDFGIFVFFVIFVTLPSAVTVTQGAITTSKWKRLSLKAETTGIQDVSGSYRNSIGNGRNTKFLCVFLPL
jgi:hypothetical protein